MGKKNSERKKAREEAIAATPYLGSDIHLTDAQYCYAIICLEGPMTARQVINRAKEADPKIRESTVAGRVSELKTSGHIRQISTQVDPETKQECELYEASDVKQALSKYLLTIKKKEKTAQSIRVRDEYAAKITKLMHLVLAASDAKTQEGKEILEELHAVYLCLYSHRHSTKEIRRLNQSISALKAKIKQLLDPSSGGGSPLPEAA